MLHHWSATSVAYSARCTAHSLFEGATLAASCAQAVGHSNQSLSYTEMECQTARLGAKLVCEGVGPDGIVGLGVAKGIEEVAGVVGRFFALSIASIN